MDSVVLKVSSKPDDSVILTHVMIDMITSEGIWVLFRHSALQMHLWPTNM